MTQNPDPSAADGADSHPPGSPETATAKERQVVFRVVMAGMSARDQRLAKILMRHDPDRLRRFELAEPAAAPPPVVLIANPFEPQGVRAIAAARSQDGVFAVIHAVPEHANAQTRFTLQLEHLSLQLMPCLKNAVELAFESSPPGETLFNRAADARAAPSHTAPIAAEEETKSNQPIGLVQRCDALVVDLNDHRAGNTLAAFAESSFSARRCDPAWVTRTVANRLADLVVLTPDETGFDIALALKTQQAGHRSGAATDVVMMMVLDRVNPITYLRARLAGCTVVMTRPLDSIRLMNDLRNPLRRLRDRRRALARHGPSGPAAGFSTSWLDTDTGH